VSPREEHTAAEISDRMRDYALALVREMFDRTAVLDSGYGPRSGVVAEFADCSTPVEFTAALRRFIMRQARWALPECPDEAGPGAEYCQCPECVFYEWVEDMAERPAPDLAYTLTQLAYDKTLIRSAEARRDNRRAARRMARATP
jgi:hypothetical protein